MLHQRGKVIIISILFLVNSNFAMQRPFFYFNLFPPEIMNLTNTYLLHSNPELISIVKLFSAQEELLNFLSKSKLSIEAFKSALEKTDQKTLATILSCRSLPVITDENYFNMVLFNSVRSNNPSMIRLLLYLDANIEFQNKDPHDPTLYRKTHYTLLAHAAEFGYIEATQLLLRAGADPNPHHPHKERLPIPASPLICALQGNTRNSSKIVELLLEAGAQLNLPDGKNQTALPFLYTNRALANAQKAHEVLKIYEKRFHHY